jgi:hypothetical protein
VCSWRWSAFQTAAALVSALRTMPAITLPDDAFTPLIDRHLSA